MNRTSDNPFADANIVYVPYCTGDLHAGNTVATFTVDGAPKPTYFWGGNNLDLYLARLVPTFASTTSRLWVAGSSAGGFATFLEYERVQKAFGVRTDTIDDSGPPIPGGASLTTVYGNGMPAGCPTCKTFTDVFDYDRTLAPDSRFALLSYHDDSVVGPDFGLTTAQFESTLDSFLNTRIVPDKNAASFIVDTTSGHVVESDATLNPQVLPWLTKMATDDSTWASVVIP